MPFYQTPGVYVQEVPSGARPIQALGTSTAGFIGAAPNPSAHLNEVVALEGWMQFVKEFANVPDPRATPLALAVRGFFDNGGRRVHVVNIGSDAGPITGTREGLSLFETVDEISVVAAPGRTDAESYESLLSHCEKMEDRFAIIDGPGTVSRVEELTQVASVSVPPNDDQDAGEDESDVQPSTSSDLGFRPRNSQYGAFYFPRIVIANPFGSGAVQAPASGHLAGIYARTDGTRGVHKAPANEPVRGALNLTYRVTREEQGVLNPKGVNCLRFFPGDGIKVWGARTLADAASEYRYVPVRRLVNMLKESIGTGTQWVVFEPNDYTLWSSIRRDIRAFLTRVWRDGALMGRTPEEAFFVKCDEETNPPEAIDAGEVRCLIGIAPVKPAEFVIFQISHTEPGSDRAETES